MITNSGNKYIFCRVEGGDAHWKLSWLPVVTSGAESREGGGIARAWIAYTPIDECPNDGVHAKEDIGGYRRPFCSLLQKKHHQ